MLDFNNDGALDILVTCIGSMAPTDDPVGSVGLLINDGAMNFKGRVILDSIGRAADVQPGDLDGDGDLDFSVADFGYLNRGGVGWLEQKEAGRFEYHVISRKAGAINVPLADLDGDHQLDIVVVIAQEHEEVSLFLNQKKSRKKMQNRWHRPSGFRRKLSSRPRPPATARPAFNWWIWTAIAIWTSCTPTATT